MRGVIMCACMLTRGFRSSTFLKVKSTRISSLSESVVSTNDLNLEKALTPGHLILSMTVGGITSGMFWDKSVKNEPECRVRLVIAFYFLFFL